MEQSAHQAAVAVAQALAERYGALPHVTAVALAGSRVGDAADHTSDLDLYVYSVAEVPLVARSALAAGRGSELELDNRAFELGDVWVEVPSGLVVDVTFRRTVWVEGTLDWVLRHAGASVGYSTCIWANVLASRILFDRDGWFAALKTSADVPYPEPLRRAIIAKNHPLLRRAHFSYVHQIEQAVARRDPVSVNHRVAALLASYFDILFALNRVPHPGEKRLVALARERCPILPEGMAHDIAELLTAAGPPTADVLAAAGHLVDALDHVLIAEGLIAP